MRIKVIVNPMARTGKSGKNWPEVEARLRRHAGEFDVSFTEAPGEAKPIAEAALADGFDHFVTVGGDGTVNEVLNGLVDDGKLANPESVICPIPAGTANEVCRNLGLLEDPDAPYKAIRGGEITLVDLQRGRCAGADGQAKEHYALLATSFGSAAEISYKTSASKYIKKLGAEFSYYLVTAIVMLSYKPKATTLIIDGGEAEEMRLHSALMCNMETTGGGMKLAPGARPDDGIFRGVIFGDFTAMEFFTKPPSWLFEGRHVDHPKVSLKDGRTLRVSCAERTMVDADGEFIGYLPLELEVIPKAIRIKV